MAVNLLVLPALAVGCYLLARRWRSPTTAAGIALVATLNPATLGWSQMLNFAVTASACSVWALTAYLYSEGFTRWRWSLATGVSIALLSLSRTISPVYVAPMLIVMAAQVLTGERRRALGSVLPKIAVAATAALAVAGPWWIVSGRTAFRYLRSAGYAASSGFNSGSPNLLRGAADRARWTVTDLGDVATATLAAAGVIALLVLARRRHLGRDGQAVVAWLALTFALLSTSSNHGTAFGLPLVTVLIIALGVELARLPPRSAVVAAGIVGVVLMVGITGQFAGAVKTRVRGPVYRSLVVGAGADPTTNVDELHQRVVRLVGVDGVVLARDDTVLNAPGIAWTSSGRTRVLLPSFGPDGTASAIAQLSDAQFLLTGSTAAPFHHGVDMASVEAAAQQRGFHLVETWTLGPANSVRIWTH